MKNLFVAALIAITATAACAESTATAGWAGLTFTLVDLTPNDGITPTLITTFHGDCGWDLGSPCSLPKHPVPPDYPPRLGAVHSLTAYPTEIGPLLTVGDFGDINYFEMSPNTKVTISGSISASSTGPSSFSKIKDDLLFTYFMNASGESSYELASAIGTQRSTVYSRNGSDSASFSFVLNSDTDPINFSLKFDQELRTITSYNIAPVPEPKTYAMMLVGLSGLAVVLRRRRLG